MNAQRRLRPERTSPARIGGATSGPILESWLCGVKRHRRDPFLMSFAGDGYSLSVDLPARVTRRADFMAYFERLVAMALDHGGRFNLSKDHLLNRQQFRAMYPESAQFLELKARVDPNGLFASDLQRWLMG